MDSTNRIIEPSLFGVMVQLNSIYFGTSLTSIQLPDQCALLGILRNGKVISVKETPKIYAGDWILAMAIHPMMVPELKVALKKTHPVYYSMSDCSLNSFQHSMNFFEL